MSPIYLRYLRQPHRNFLSFFLPCVSIHLNVKAPSSQSPYRNGWCVPDTQCGDEIEDVSFPLCSADPASYSDSEMLTCTHITQGSYRKYILWLRKLEAGAWHYAFLPTKQGGWSEATFRKAGSRFHPVPSPQRRFTPSQYLYPWLFSCSLPQHITYLSLLL